MSTTRLFSPVSLQADSAVTLGEEQARYIGKVLRLRPGDTVRVFDGGGGEYAAVIDSVRKTQIIIKVGTRLAANVESPLSIHLLQGVSRGERMEFVVQKATELGVSRITPVLSEFSVVKLDAGRAEKRQQHWTKIAISACEQSGRNTLPGIDAPITLRNWFGNNAEYKTAAELRIVFLPGATRSVRELAIPAAQLTVLIGPEGGFSDAEHEQAAACGFSAVGFGPRILRTETAAIAAIAALQTLYGDLGG